MALYYRTRGFVFKKTDRGEADQLFTIYTEDFGRIEILGKAIRKIKSKLRSGAELFYFSEIEFIQGKAYKTLTDAIPIERFENIRKDLEKLEISHQIAELLGELIRGQEKDDNIFCLLVEVFDKLNNLKNEKIIYHYFFWNLFSFLGYQIDFYHCLVCQKKLTPENLYFDINGGGIVCSNCYKKHKKGEIIFPDVIKILRIFLNKDWNLLKRLKIKEEEVSLLKKISKQYLSFYQKEKKLLT